MVRRWEVTFAAGTLVQRKMAQESGMSHFEGGLSHFKPWPVPPPKWLSHVGDGVSQVGKWSAPRPKMVYPTNGVF